MKNVLLIKIKMKFCFFVKRKDNFWFRCSVITSLAFYFLWVRLTGEESVSEEEEVDVDDEGKVGRNGHPKRSEIGRRCCWFSSGSGRAQSSLSIWLSLLE
jgi:hypothetical protein